MGMNKKLWIIIGAIAFSCLFCGCESKESSVPQSKEYVYVSDFYEYETDYTWVSSAISFGEDLLITETFYFNHPISRLKQINLSTGEIGEYDIGLPKERYIAAIVEMPEGYLVYSEEYVHDSSVPKEYELYTVGASHLGYYDKDFALQKEVDITSFVMDKSSFSQMCEGIVVDDTEKVYFLYQDTIYVLNGDGIFLTEITPNASDVLDMTYGSGNVLVLYADPGQKLQIAPLDLEDKAMGQPMTELPQTGYWATIFTGKKDELYLTGADYFYQYDSENHSWEQELKWLECDLDGLGIQHCLEVDGKIVCLKYNNLAYEVTVLTKTPISQVKEKEILRVTMLKKDYVLLEQVSGFNRRNQKIRLESEYYVEGDSPQELEEGIMQFQLDLISGDIGDIIFVSRELDYDNLAKKGAFASLDELLETDEKLSKADFIESITEIFSVDDTLYGFVPMFSMVTLAGKSSDVGIDESWTVADMAELSASHEGASLLDNTTRINGLRQFLSGSMSSYYDMNTGKCSFNGEEFKQLLQIMNTLPEEITEYNSDFPPLKEGKVLLAEIFFYDYSVLRGYRALCGEDIHFIGYPVTSGFGTLANVGNGVYTISASSKHKEAAWQFLREFLLDDYQDSIEYAFPVTKQALEQMLAEEMNRVYPENYTHSFYGFTLENVPMSEEDARYIRDLINSIRDNNSYDYRLMNLILEEAESYFSGQKTLDEVVNIIQNRAQLYVDENM